MEGIDIDIIFHLYNDELIDILKEKEKKNKLKTLRQKPIPNLIKKERGWNSYLWKKEKM